MIEVPPNQYQRAEALDTLSTHEVYTCLVVGLRIRQLGTGYLGHFFVEPADQPLERVHEMKQVAKSEAGSCSITAWAAGLAIDYSEAGTTALRKDVTTALEDEDFRLAHTLWLPKGFAIDRVKLCLPDAKFTAPFVPMHRWKSSKHFEITERH